MDNSNAIRHLPHSACPDCFLSLNGVYLCPAHASIGAGENEAERLAREAYEKAVESGGPWNLGYG